jgi:ABC-2 type transport system permease protein
MRNALAIARKELSIYFTTPVAYVVFFAMVVLSSFFFVGYLQAFQDVQAQARQYTWAALEPEAAVFRNLTDGVVLQMWGLILVVTLFVSPFLSMGLIAREQRQKTMELLMTTPVRAVELVLGKYLGALGLIFATLGLGILYPLILSAFGNGTSGFALEWSTVLLGFGALLLWGATCMAVGLFISALTDSEMLAALLTFAVLLPWMLLNGFAQRSEGTMREVLNYLSFNAQLEPLLRGILELRPLVFLGSVIAFFLFLTHRAIEARRWA